MRAIAVVAIALACKTDPPAAKSGSGSSTSTSTSTIKLGEPKPELMPDLGGELLLPAKPTEDRHQIHATWCLATDSFASATRAVRASLEDQMWTNIAARGDIPTAGITADREGHHLGVIVAALRAGPCAEPGHYRVTATLTADR